MIRREFLKTVGAAGAAAFGTREAGAQPAARTAGRRLDLHTHYYPPAYFDRVRDSGGEFGFDRSPTGQTIIKYRGARFFGITPPMTDVAKRIDDMDRVGIDVEVVSLSTPNVFFTDGPRQVDVAKMVNDAYAELAAKNPKRFKAFASIPMDAPQEALKELHRAVNELKLNGVILLSNIRGNALTAPQYRTFFEEANRMKLCIFVHPMLPANPDTYREYVLGPIIGFPCDTTLAVARMCYDGMFKDFPDIRWLIAHAGGATPFLMERMDSGYRDFAECKVKLDQLPSTYLKRLYYDTVTFSQHNLKMLREMVGADHMVMGSDYPHLLGSIEKAVSSIEAMDCTTKEKQQIFEGTAMAIMNNV
jgi:aminocarboxymuconate-semialdehyde decarboxylase